VRPTGTTATLFTAGQSARRSSSVRVSAAPSFQPGQQTIWQFIVICACAKRRRMSSASPARGERSIFSRSAGSVVWTETFTGEMCRSTTRRISRGERFVSVM
jgi:hypothetical protein